MGIDRRSFFKTMGLVGVTLSVGKSLSASETTDNKIEFSGILYDSTRCVGCQECERVCATIHDLPEPDANDTPIVGVVRKTSDTRRSVINSYATSKGELFVKTQCMHCNQPACGAACLTQAMYKTKQGPVIWRKDKCMGCRYCMVSCPFDVPKFEYNSANPKIVKCDLCFDRQVEGKLPACAENCPAEALMFGTRRELIAEARKRINDRPDQYYGEIYGEHEAGGTGFLYLSSVPFEELGMNTHVKDSSYPALTKGFLYSVPTVFVLWPALLLGLHNATTNNNPNELEHE